MRMENHPEMLAMLGRIDFYPILVMLYGMRRKIPPEILAMLFGMGNHPVLAMPGRMENHPVHYFSIIYVYSNDIMANLKTLQRQKEVVPVFLGHGISSTLIIPIAMARHYSLDKPSHVVLEAKDDGIMIKKLEI